MRKGRRIPVALDTHDIQARQYELRNRAGFFIPPYIGYDDMLTIELEWTKRADVCIHINAEEFATFHRLLPDARHELVYPSVAAAPSGVTGRQIILVASNNAANLISVRWFLKEVLPLSMRRRSRSSAISMRASEASTGGFMKSIVTSSREESPIFKPLMPTRRSCCFRPEKGTAFR